MACLEGFIFFGTGFYAEMTGRGLNMGSCGDWGKRRSMVGLRLQWCPTMVRCLKALKFCLFVCLSAFFDSCICSGPREIGCRCVLGHAEGYAVKLMES